MALEQIGLEAVLRDSAFQAGLARYTSGLAKAEKSTDVAASKTSILSKATTALGSALGNTLKIAAGVGVGLAGIGAAVGKVGFDFNTMRQQAEISFTTMLGSGEKAKSFLDDLAKFAATTPFEFPELVEAGKSLVAFGFDAKEVIPTMTRLGDIAAGIGINVNELTQIYGKARVQGRLFAEDINQLTGRGIPITKELAKQFGVTEAEVRGLVEAGKVGFPQLEKAFQSMTDKGGQFAGLMAAQSQSFAGLMSTLTDTLTQAAGVLTKPLFDLATSGLKDLTDWLGSPEVQNGLQRFAEDSARWLKETMIPAVQDFVKTVQTEWPKLQQTITDFWTASQPVLLDFQKWLTTDGVYALDVFFRKIREGQDTGKEFIGMMGEMKDAATIAMQGITGDANVQFPSLAWIVGNAMDVLNQTARSKLDILQGIWRAAGSAVRGDFSGFMESVKQINQGVMESLLSVVGVKLGDVKARFNEAGKWLVDTVNGWREPLMSAASSMMQGLIDGFWSQAGAIQAALSDIINQAINNIKAMLGIHSPSRVFAEMGANMARGLTQGFGTPQLSFTARGASYAAGGWVQQTGPALVHRGEYVIPARTMQNITNINSSAGGSTLNFNFGAVYGVNDFDYRVRQIVNAHDRGH